jgi:tetratricopeptide (TPR) repeat protein
MKIAEMDILYEQNKEDIEILGRQFGIVTRNTSLLVLEEIADYVRYEITPPAELLVEYNQMLKNARELKERRVSNLLERAIATVEELKTWWNTDFSAQKRFPVPQKDEGAVLRNREAVAADEMVIWAEESMDVANIVENRISMAARAAPPPAMRAFAGEASGATGAESKALGSSQPGQVAYFNIPKIKNDKDYLKQINASADPYAEYLKLRKEYMGTPGFFFDVSDLFYEKQQKETGLLVLSCLADLELENAELFKTLAYKLKEKGYKENELFITRKIREWRPMDPQSHRDYALALQDNGRYQEALECLYSILNASYSPESASRDFGIEEVIVCEINNLISRHRGKLDLSNIDPKIIAGMPVNIRVVINWNKNDTDIDLWVTDPNGEKCYYGNRQTAMGGRISNDFTQGFGPEQFLLKKAINGTYKVETNFFGERQVTLSGPTTIMAEIYLYYSDGRQERQVVTFRSGESGKERDGVLIGEFVFSDSKVTSEMIEILVPDEVEDIEIADNDNVIIANNGYEPDSKSGHTPFPIIIIAGIGCLGYLFFVRGKKNG